MGKRKEYSGTVISDKMTKTIIVRIMHLSKHPKYKRVLKQYNKFKVHDEKGIAKVGDFVRIRETRPLSKDKRYILVGILKKLAVVDVELKDDALLNKKVE